MTKCIVVPLRELIENNDESVVQRFLSTFSCTRDTDLETFIRERAILFENRDLARTYLLIETENGTNIIKGYFSLALTTINLPSESEISISLRKRMGLLHNKTTGYLIGQLCKSDGVKEKLGNYMIGLAMKKIEMGIETFAGKIVCIDCKISQPLIDWYKSMGFIVICKIPDRNLCRMAWIRHRCHQTLPKGNSPA